MTRYFFEISFDGTPFHGWQSQPGLQTVQQTIEDNLEKFLRRKVKIHGCGRTDSGVHATQYFFHVDLQVSGELVYRKLNRMLPSKISVRNYFIVRPNANAQHDAISRSYTYKIALGKSPFDEHAWVIHEKLDLGLLDQLASLIVGKHDFAYFCKRPHIMPNTICNVSGAFFTLQADSRMLIFQITANRFVHNMIRLLVGNMVKVAKGRLDREEFENYLHLKKQPKFFEIAPAEGLLLSEVKYRDSVLEK